jgi:ABC-type nitrate/sulfonate/bicarbonate transport system substrate-binding protein
MDLDSLTPGYPATCWAATASYIASHKTIVNNYVDGIQQAILLMAAHPSLLTATVIAEASGLPSSEASSIVVPTNTVYSTSLNPPGILSYETLMQKYGYLTQPIMPLSAVNYIAPGTPMTKLLFNAAGKFIVKKTITCIKGKLTKRVTGVSPKCPSGYHLKK